MLKGRMKFKTSLYQALLWLFILLPVIRILAILITKLS